jgi:hypothetical protein
MLGGAFSVAWLYGNTGRVRDFFLSCCAKQKTEKVDAVNNKSNVIKVLLMGMSKLFNYYSKNKLVNLVKRKFKKRPKKNTQHFKFKSGAQKDFFLTPDFINFN